MAIRRFTNLGSMALSESVDGVVSNYVPDPAGNVVALRDATGAITDTYTYWPYGALRTHSGANGQPLTYAGQIGYYGDRSDRIYVRGRSLRPGLGSWSSADPSAADWQGNLYEYAAANPVTLWDYLGAAPSRRGWKEKLGDALRESLGAGRIDDPSRPRKPEKKPPMPPGSKPPFPGPPFKISPKPGKSDWVCHGYLDPPLKIGDLFDPSKGIGGIFGGFPGRVGGLVNGLPGRVRVDMGFGWASGDGSHEFKGGFTFRPGRDDWFQGIGGTYTWRF